MDVNWNGELLEQLEFEWEHALRPRFAGLTDDEYFWEPVPACWNVRPRGTSQAPISAGAGDFTMDFAIPEPDPPPVTTIAWRIGHLIVGIFGMRNAGHFGGEPVDYPTADYPGNATDALTALDAGYDAWCNGVRGLGAAGLAEPAGPSEGPYADSSMAMLVLHINREVIHHGAEIALLRDLYRAQR